MNGGFKYDIIKRAGTLAADRYGHTLELNVIAYGNGSHKVDIRRWNGDVMMKGISLTRDEAALVHEALGKLLEEWDG